MRSSVIFYSSPNIILVVKSMMMKWVGHIARMKAKLNAYKVLVGKPERKGPLGRSRHSREDNIKMDLKEIGLDMNWINLAEDRNQYGLV
jgi:hypothetical protein